MIYPAVSQPEYPISDLSESRLKSASLTSTASQYPQLASASHRFHSKTFRRVWDFFWFSANENKTAKPQNSAAKQSNNSAVSITLPDITS